MKSIFLAFVACANCYTLPALRLAAGHAAGHAAATPANAMASTGASAVYKAMASTGASPTRSRTPVMGLFGLGWAELGVIGVLALFIFGPDKLVPFAKNLGKQSAGLKVRLKRGSWSTPRALLVSPWPCVLHASPARLTVAVCPHAQEITDSFAEGMSEAEKMPNLKSAASPDSLELEQEKVKKEEK